MARHKVEICGVNTANIKVLTSEETLELFKKMKDGDLFARDDLINGNLKLVLSILRKFAGKVDNLDDLLNFHKEQDIFLFGILNKFFLL